jgi:hypothetical protein
MKQMTSEHSSLAPAAFRKTLSATRNDALAIAGGIVAVLLNVPNKVRFRCSLLGLNLRFGLAALATRDFPRTLPAGRPVWQPSRDTPLRIEPTTRGENSGGNLAVFRSAQRRGCSTQIARVRRSRLLKPIGLLGISLLCSCSESIDIPAPTQLEVTQIAYGVQGAVEVGWKLSLRAETYLLFYDDDASGTPYTGEGLSLAQWSAGCGDFDAGTLAPYCNGGDFRTEAGAGEDSAADAGARDGAMDALPRDAHVEHTIPDSKQSDTLAVRDLGPVIATNSPVTIPAQWCLDQLDTLSDAGFILQETPGMRPRVHLEGLMPGKKYYFAVQVQRQGKTSPLSVEASIDILLNKPQ